MCLRTAATEPQCILLAVPHHHQQGALRRTGTLAAEHDMPSKQVLAVVRVLHRGVSAAYDGLGLRPRTRTRRVNFQDFVWPARTIARFVPSLLFRRALPNDPQPRATMLCLSAP